MWLVHTAAVDKSKAICKVAFPSTSIDDMAKECQDGQGDMREGKEPMTCELYHLLCTWFVEMGTQDAMFAHCFLVLTWNLMCRGNNTSRICMSHLQWFNDAMRIFFANTKTDQQGNQAKYPRHIYANPGERLGGLSNLCFGNVSNKLQYSVGQQ